MNQGFLAVKLKSSLRKFYGRHHDLVNRVTCYVCCYHNLVPSSFINYHKVCKKIIATVPHMEQELLTLPPHMSSPSVFCGISVTRSLFSV
jgi:hypothetical protein